MNRWQCFTLAMNFYWLAAILCSGTTSTHTSGLLSKGFTRLCTGWTPHPVKLTNRVFYFIFATCLAYRLEFSFYSHTLILLFNSKVCQCEHPDLEPSALPGICKSQRCLLTMVHHDYTRMCIYLCLERMMIIFQSVLWRWRIFGGRRKCIIIKRTACVPVCDGLIPTPKSTATATRMHENLIARLQKPFEMRQHDEYQLKTLSGIESHAVCLYKTHLTHTGVPDALLGLDDAWGFRVAIPHRKCQFEEKQTIWIAK